MNPGPGWNALLERALGSRAVLVLGDTDAGKTRLTADLASALAGRGCRVGIVDADLGQSEIGPPTTVGLGLADRPLAALAEAPVVALAWVGRTSPVGVEERLVEATARLAERGRALGLAPILVDTCGLVRGDRGRALKLAKLRRVAPDLVVCLEREAECEAIVAALPAGEPAVVRLPVAPAVRRRSTEERRAHRERRLQAHLAGSATVEVSLAAVQEAGDLVDGDAEPEGLLAGLEDAAGDTLGLGRVVAVDRSSAMIVIETPVAGARVARVRVGPERLVPAGAGRGA